MKTFPIRPVQDHVVEANVARQGRVLKDLEVGKIVSLLASTEMSIPDIAERFGCSRSAVVSINRRFHVRDYGKHRTRWALSSSYLKKNKGASA